MAKKRRSKKEKVILDLKRKLARQKELLEKGEEGKKAARFEPEAIKSASSLVKENKGSSIFFYSPAFIRKDLGKTLLITLFILVLEFVLYSRLN